MRWNSLAFTVRRRPDWLTALVLALLVAATQSGYVLHELHHAVEYVTHTQDDDGDHDGHHHHGHDVCLLCVAYGALAGTLPSMPQVVAAAGVDEPHYRPPETAYRPVHQTHYSPRAPPCLRS
jgi:hypothetical protein